MSLCAIGFHCYTRLINRLKYKETTLKYVEYDAIRPHYVDKEYIKREVNKLFNISYKIYYKDLPKDTGGKSIIAFRIVMIDNNLPIEQYALALTHELVHLKYFTANERFTSFKTFQTLYESNNDYFMAVALAYANHVFSGKEPYEYDCGGYIEEYLLKEKSLDNLKCN